MPKFRGKDYVLTGAAEAPLAYFAYASIGASWAIHSPIFGLVKDGLVHVFVARDAMKHGRVWCLRQSPVALEKKFHRWCRHWEALDDELYALATGKKSDWKDAWKRLDSFAFRLFFEAYLIEWFDPFALEIERLIRADMRRAGIPQKYFPVLLTPRERTLPQRLAAEKKVLPKTLQSWKRFARTHWYFLGHWAGGELLMQRKQLHGLAFPTERALRERRTTQETYEALLQPTVRKYVQLLRLFALWREERKGFLQRICLAYQNVLHHAAQKSGIPFPDLLWVTRRETEQNTAIQKIVAARKRGEVQIALPTSRSVRMITGVEADQCFAELLEIRNITTLHGITAFAGKVQGQCRVVIRPQEFASFRTGEILITTMTRPEFLPLMRRAKAIVTDEGGLTSHAAIVARELRIPCVVGTRDGTRVLQTGEKIFVDATKGIVRRVS